MWLLASFSLCFWLLNKRLEGVFYPYKLSCNQNHAIKIIQSKSCNQNHVVDNHGDVDGDDDDDDVVHTTMYWNHINRKDYFDSIL